MTEIAPGSSCNATCWIRRRAAVVADTLREMDARLFQDADGTGAVTDPRLDLAIDGPIARLTIRRADKLNALDAAMADRASAAVPRVERSAARVPILTGEGERSFSAGGDIEAWSSLSPEAWLALAARRASGLLARWRG